MGNDWDKDECIYTAQFSVNSFRASDTCQNGGKCTENRYTFKCLCPEGYTGSRCHGMCILHTPKHSRHSTHSNVCINSSVLSKVTMFSIDWWAHPIYQSHNDANGLPVYLKYKDPREYTPIFQNIGICDLNFWIFPLAFAKKTGIFWTFIKIFSNTVNLMVLEHFSESSTSIFSPNGI